MSIKRQLSLALVIGVGSSLVGCKTPMGSGLAFWKNNDSSMASTAPDATNQKYGSLAKEFGGSKTPSVGLGGTPPPSTDGPVVSSWNKATAAVAAAFTPTPKVETDDPTSLTSKTGKVGPDVHINLGRVYESQNKTAEAIAQYEKALAMRPNDLTALVSLARLHDRQGNATKSVELYQRALKSNPKSGLVHNDLGLCYARQKQWQRATESLSKAVEVHPTNPKYRNNLASVMVEMGRTDEALKQLAAVNSEAIAHYNLAYLLQQKGQSSLAVMHLQQAVNRDPTLGPAHEMLAELMGTSNPGFAGQGFAGQGESRIAAQPVSTPIYRPQGDMQWQPQTQPQLAPQPASQPPVSQSPAQIIGSGGSYHIGDDIGPIQPVETGRTGVEPLPPIEG
ncbi:MAG: tetratricopeptide repeat protein [Planctomycetaceae bacterium]|nr:tetratricopeptide repeat protein [Planctomycetaceae bacterium]